jgi:hypothetical protein
MRNTYRHKLLLLISLVFFTINGNAIIDSAIKLNRAANIRIGSETLQVKGPVSGVWGDEVSGKLIEVTGNIWIEPNSTLEILPGTEVIFQNNFSFLVSENARLKAVGGKSEGDSILFTALGERTWKGLKFNKGALIPEIEYCIFSKTRNNLEDEGEGIVSAALHLQEVSDEFKGLSNCSFINNTGGAIYIFRIGLIDNFSLSNIKIINCATHAISIKGGYYNTLEVSNSSIMGSGLKALSGINIKDCGRINTLKFENLTISGCEDDKIDSPFQLDNEGSAIYVDRNIEIENVTVSNVVLKDNEALTSVLYLHSNHSIGINSLEVLNSQATLGSCNLLTERLTIINSRFEDCRPLNYGLEGGALVIQDTIQRNGNLFIDINNSVFKNNENRNRNGNSINIENPNNKYEKISLTNSEFSNHISDNNSNRGNGGVIAINSGSIDLLAIENNSFEKNTAYDNGGVIYIDTEDLLQARIRANIFSDNNTIKNNGGVIYFNTNSINSFVFSNNNLDKNISNGSGGTLFIHSDEIGDLEINENKSPNDAASSSSLEGSGGFANLEITSIGRLFVSNNQNINSRAEGNGGFINFSEYLENAGKFEIKSNKNLSAKSENGDGGLLYLNGNTLNGLALNLNSFDSLGAVNGGLVHLNLNQLSNFTSSENLFSDINVKKNGGLFNVSLLELNDDFNILKDEVTKCTIAGDGGIVYLNAQNISESLIYDGNIIGKIDSVKRGGVLFISSDSDACSITRGFKFTNNSITSAISVKDKGGVIFSEANINGGIEIDNNNFFAVVSENSGAYYFIEKMVTEDLLNVSILNENQEMNNGGSSHSNNGHGAWFSMFTPRKLNKLEIANNRYNTLQALKSGGGFYIESPYINEIQLSNNSIQSTQSIDGNGGFISFKSDTIGWFEITKNSIMNSSKANEAGGFVSLMNSNVKDKLIFTENEFVGEVGANEGGILFIGGNDTAAVALINDIKISDNLISADNNSSINGGYFYFRGNICNILNFNHNHFLGEIRNKDDGGIFFVENVVPEVFPNDKLKLDSISFTNNLINSKYISSRNGNFVSVKGALDLQSFTLEGNRIECDSVLLIDDQNLGAGGGIVSIIGNNISIRQINFSDNIYSGSIYSAAPMSKGGVLNFDARLAEGLKVERDSVTGEISVGQGGYFNIKNRLDLPLNCSITNSFFNVLESSKYNGALINLNTKNIENFNFISNEIGSSYAEGSAAIFIESFSIDEIRSEWNIFKCKATGNGGVFNLYSAYNKSRVRNATSFSDTFSDCHSLEANGGVFYSNFDSISSILFDAAKINNVSARNNGGFLSISEGKVVESFVFQNSEEINGVKTNDGSGGMFYFNGGLVNSYISNNKIYNISAGNNGGMIYFKGQDNKSNLYFSNNYIKNDNEQLKSKNGGVLYCSNLGKLTMENNDSLIQISADDSGGILFASQIDTLKFKWNSCISNFSTFGGVGYIEEANHVSMEENKFKGNRAILRGGALYLKESGFSMSSDTLIYNSSNEGGGLYFDSTGGEISGLRFEHNYLNNENNPNFDKNGGAVFINNESEELIITHSSFGHHITADYGGAIYALAGSFNMVGNVFFNNQAKNKGSALYVLEDATNSSIYNCLFHNNNTVSEPDPNLNKSALNIDFGGKGVVNIRLGSDSDTLKVVNCTFNKGNFYAIGIEKLTANNEISGRCIFKNNIIWDFNNGEYVSVYDPGNFGILSYNSLRVADTKLITQNSIFGDPGLNACNGLTSYSRCIDKGDPALNYNDILDFMLGTVRNDLGITGGPYAIYLCPADYVVSNDLFELNDSFGEKDLDFGIRIFPNPAKSYIHIEPGDIFGKDVMVIIYNMAGIVTDSFVFHQFNSGEIKKINIEKYQPGTYFLSISSNNYKGAKKIVIL